jgi:hypothetical protein
MGSWPPRRPWRLDLGPLLARESHVDAISGRVRLNPSVIEIAARPRACTPVPSLLVSARADEGHDQEERDGNQEIEDATRSEAESFRGQRRGPALFHQPESVDSRPTGAEPPGRTACAQLRENEFTGDSTFPDESVSLAFRERAPAEIAGGTGRTPNTLSDVTLGSGVGGRKGGAARAAPPCLLCVDYEIQRQFAFTGP